MSIARIHPTPFCFYCDKEGLPSDHLLRDKSNKENKRKIICPVIVKLKKERKEEKKKGEMYFEHPSIQVSRSLQREKKEKKEKEKRKKIKKDTVIPLLQKEKENPNPNPKLTIEVLDFCKSIPQYNIYNADEIYEDIEERIEYEGWTSDYYSDIDKFDEYTF